MDPLDRQLVLEAQRGNREAFASLVDRYRGRIYALALSIVAGHEAAVALTRETFVRAYRELDTLEAPERFAGWLARVAYKAGHDAGPEGLEDSEASLALERSDGLTVTAPFDKTEAERALIEALLSALPERMRVALDLRYREELTYQEIAETLEVSRDDVETLLRRAARKLRSKLRPHLRSKRKTA